MATGKRSKTGTAKAKKGKVEVRVQRVERYACGCTTTQVHTAQVAEHWVLACGGHGGKLTSVQTTMEYAEATGAVP